MPSLFLGLDEVLAIHRDQIERYGGSTGVRDMGLLQSAVAMPQSAFGGHYAHADLYEMAAAYLFHIVQNHPFVDGNKRTGAVSALVFLYMNDVDFAADERGFEARVWEVAAGQATKGDVAAFFRTGRTAG